MKAFFNFLFSILIATFSYSQTALYVSADNGLYAREAPSRGANIITKLNYGTKVDVVERTNLNIDVLDKGNKISGQWVKINAYTNYNYIEGYVFNGYLTKEKLKPRFRATFENFKVTVDDLLTVTTELGTKTIETDTLHYDVELGHTPEDKIITIKPTIHYKKIEVFQSYQTSLTIMDEGPHCDLLNGSHYTSNWVALKSQKKNRYQTCSYSESDWNTFIDLNIETLKNEVREYCGETYARMIKNIGSLNEYPSAVSISTIYIKVILTDLENNKIKKIIAFKIPMGC